MCELEEGDVEDEAVASLIDLGEDTNLVRRTVKELGYSARVALDADMRVSKAYGVRATPTVVLVGRDGHLLAIAVGPRPGTGPDRRALLRRLLADRRSSAR